MKVNMSRIFDHTNTINLIIFSSAAFLTLIIWLLLGKIFLPPKVEIHSQAAQKAQDISTKLNFETVASIKQKRSFSNSQLADFQIYLLNSKVNYNTGELSIKYFKAISPLDLAYSALLQHQLIDN